MFHSIPSLLIVYFEVTQDRCGLGTVLKVALLLFLNMLPSIFFCIHYHRFVFAFYSLTIVSAVKKRTKKHSRKEGRVKMATGASSLLALLLSIVTLTTPAFSAGTSEYYLATFLPFTYHIRRVTSLGQNSSVTSDSPLFISRTANGTVAVFHPKEGKFLDLVKPPIVNNTGYLCTLNVTLTDTFSYDFPFQPSGITLKASGSRLLISALAPAADIFAIDGAADTTNSTSSLLSFNVNVSQLHYSKVAGTPICTTEISSLNATVRAQDAIMKAASHLKHSPGTIATGGETVYFTQTYSVFALTSDGYLQRYFGSELEPANRSSEKYSAVQRLDARTQYPSQIDIDETRQVMYIAETGMGTVRQINMTSGEASVFMGAFLTYVWPPPNCSISDNCTMKNVTLLAPTAVAVYHARTVRETWVFVGDLTAAVVYKVVLESGSAFVVAGQMLNSGTASGFVGSSQLHAVHCFTVIHSYLYIADGSLRRLDLKDVPVVLPPDPVVSQTVITATSTTVVASTLVVAVVNPGMVTQASRANVILVLAQCQRDFGELPIFTHLLGFPIGDDVNFKYYAGAVVGNMSLCLGILVLDLILVVVYAFISGNDFADSAGKMKFPSLLALPLLFALEPTIAVATSLSIYGSDGMLTLGLAGLSISLTAFIIIAGYFIVLFKGIDDFEFFDNKISGGFVRRMIYPCGEWLQTDLTKRMGMFFEDYLPETWWFVVAELGMCVVTGILEGIKPEEYTNCVVLVVISSTFYCAFVLMLFYFKPYRVRFRVIFSIVVAGLQGAGSVVSIGTVVTRDPRWTGASTSLVLMSLYLSTVQSIVELILLVKGIIHYIEKHGIAGLFTFSKSYERSKLVISSENDENSHAMGFLSGSFAMRQALHNDSLTIMDFGERQLSGTTTTSTEEEELRNASNGAVKQKRKSKKSNATGEETDSDPILMNVDDVDKDFHNKLQKHEVLRSKIEEMIARGQVDFNAASSASFQPASSRGDDFFSAAGSASFANGNATQLDNYSLHSGSQSSSTTLGGDEATTSRLPTTSN